MKKIFQHCLVIGISLFLSFQIQAQCELRGTLTDKNNQVLVGANIYIDGLRKGDISDKDGKYSIENVKPGVYTINFSYLGYKPEAMTIVIPQNSARFLLNLSLEEQAYSLQTTEITALRADDKTPMTYSSVSKETLNKNDVGQDMPYLLQWTPSLVVTSDAGAGVGYTGMRIRGSDGERINVTVNGIPLNDAESQRVYWVDLPDLVGSTDDIQIQRGVGTSSNGAGAFGASINLKTNDLHQESYAKIGSTYGSFNTFKRNISFGTGLLKNKITLDGRLSHISSDGYIDRASSDLTSYALSAAYLGKKSVLKFNIFSGHEVTYQAWNGISPTIIDSIRTYNSAGEDKPEGFYDNEVDDYTQTHYQLLYANQFTLNWKLNLALHYTKGGGFFENYKGGEDFEDYGINPGAIPDDIVSTDLIRRKWLDNDFYGGVYALTYTDNAQRMEAIVGGSYNIYKGRHFGEVIWARYSIDETPLPYYDNNSKKTDFNFYAKVNYKLNPVLYGFADLQFRNTGYSFLGIDDDLKNIETSVDHNFFNPKAGFLYHLNRNAKVYASFAVANREPNRNDYTENPISKAPEAETLYNTELGYQLQKEKVALNLTAYHMFYRNQLALDGHINDVGEYTRINVDKSYRAGIELGASVQLPLGFAINGNATFSQNKVANFTEFIDDWDTGSQTKIEHTNTDLPFSPNVIAGVELSATTKMKSEKNETIFALQFKYVGKQFLDLSADDKTALDAYSFANFRLNHTWKPTFAKEINFTFMVNNIFDHLYESNGWSYKYISGGSTNALIGLYPQAGRSFMVGLSVGF